MRRENTGRGENFGPSFHKPSGLNLLSHNISDCTLTKLKLISILYLTLIHSAETRRSRSATAEEPLAAAHKKGIGVSFLFGGEKKEGGTCAMLIRESHMVERRAGEGGKKPRTGRGMDGAKEVQHSVCFSQKTSCIVNACLQLFGGTSPSCCHLHQAPSLYFNIFFLMDFLVLLSFGTNNRQHRPWRKRSVKQWHH